MSFFKCNNNFLSLFFPAFKKSYSILRLPKTIIAIVSLVHCEFFLIPIKYSYNILEELLMYYKFT